MYYNLKVKRVNGHVIEDSIDTQLDASTINTIRKSIDACVDFSIYKEYSRPYTKAWDMLIRLVQTETNNFRAVNIASKIMMRARMEVS